MNDEEKESLILKLVEELHGPSAALAVADVMNDFYLQEQEDGYDEFYASLKDKIPFEFNSPLMAACAVRMSKIANRLAKSSELSEKLAASGDEIKIKRPPAYVPKETYNTPDHDTMPDYEFLLYRYRKWLNLDPSGSETLGELIELELSTSFFKESGRQFLSHHNLVELADYVKP